VLCLHSVVPPHSASCYCTFSKCVTSRLSFTCWHFIFEVTFQVVIINAALAGFPLSGKSGSGGNDDDDDDDDMIDDDVFICVMI